MQTIKVQTTQNVFIDYPIAGVFDRILAFLLDMVIWAAYLILVFFIFGMADVLDYWVMIMIYLPVFFYNLAFEILMNGQTLGKRALNIQVVRLDGTSPTIANYIFRFILWPIDVILWGSIAITFISLTKNGQRLGDLAGGTTVVKLTKRGEVTSQQIVKSLKEEYVPQFPQTINLNDRDIKLIKEVLEMNRELGNGQPVLAATEKVKTLLGIQTDMPPVQFLYTILKDYHHLTSGLS
ncbi:MAG: RDD family protein [Cytophagales bacterium]|nr:RDD family protein [Cytophagales bacterium]